MNKEPTMSNERDLEDAVAKTAAIVAATSSKLMGLAGQVADWNSAIARATAERERHALAGLSGDASAAAATKKAIAEQRVAQENLETLALAIPAAKLELDRADRAAQGARSALSKFRSDILKRRRIDAGAELDAVIADLAKLWWRYEALGHEILNMPDAVPASSSFGMLNREGVMGLRRVAACVPKFMISWFPGALHDELKKEPLATSEARFWNLVSEQPADKAA
jgi:hypothetical protein